MKTGAKCENQKHKVQSKILYTFVSTTYTDLGPLAIGVDGLPSKGSLSLACLCGASQN